MTDSVAGLDLSRDLERLLSLGGIDYCQWKGTFGLPKALRGEKDLDLLVRTCHRDRFRDIILSLGFVEMRSHAVTAFPYMEDFLGFDMAGGLLHIHAHYRLVLGERKVLNHLLPIHDWLLTDRVMDRALPIPDRSKEFLLLFIRTMLGLDAVGLIRSSCRRYPVFSDRLTEELQWLARQVDTDSLEHALSTSGLSIQPDQLLRFHKGVLEESFSRMQLWREKRRLLYTLRRFERESGWRALQIKVYRKIRSSRLLRKLGVGIPKKILVKRAPIIALVGADGSGKTRLANDLVDWLGWKLQVCHVYFGQPKKNMVFSLLKKVDSVMGNRRIRLEAVDKKPSSILVATHRCIMGIKWFHLARTRERLFRRAQAASDRGEVVIAERYPLPDFRSMRAPMDGPRMGKIGEAEALRFLSVLELDSYDRIGRPDLVVALDARLDVLRSRKTELPLRDHAEKVEAVRAIAIRPHVTVIDAEQPYEEVLLRAKKAVWAVLHEAC